MTFYEQIQRLVIDCVAQQINIRDFRERFVPLLVRINRRADAEAAVLADSIENLYADVLIGALTEDGFRRKLAQFTPMFPVQFEWGFRPTTAATSEPAGTAIRTPTLESSSDPQLLQYA